MQKEPMTIEGAEALKKELTELKTVTRPRIVEAIAEARAHGDLKENAEYHAAKEQQAFAEGRIQEIEFKVGNAQVIDVTKLPQMGKVVFGTTVVLINIETDEEKTYRIVGHDEADIKQNLISVNSPIARGLIGKEAGDIAMINAPSGTIEFEVIEIKYI